MDGALDFHFAWLVELDRLGLSLGIGAEIEHLYVRQGKHIVEKRVDVPEFNHVANLKLQNRDFFPFVDKLFVLLLNNISFSANRTRSPQDSGKNRRRPKYPCHTH